MSRMNFDREPHNDNDLWTTARLADELFLNLASVKEKVYNSEGRAITVHKYYHQAREKMKWVPRTKGKGRNVFTIDISDLTPRLGKELIDYYKDAGKEGLTILLKLAVSKLFENLDFNYYHLSVMKYLRLELIK